MPQRIVLHIGPMKTGTSYLQAVLAELRPQLAASGWLYPEGLSPETRSHQGAIYGLIGPSMPWVSPRSAPVRGPEGAKILASTNAWQGDVLLSAETMAQLSDSAIQELLGRFTTDRVEVVITARDLGRIILSSWQQSLRNARAWPLETFLQLLHAAREPDGEARLKVRFWSYQRLSDVIDRWSRAVGRENVVVVVVPNSREPAALWRRFRSGVGLPDAIPEDPPEISRDLANVGLTHSEALLVRAISRGLARSGVSEGRRRQIIRRTITEILLPRADRGAALGLPPTWLPTVSAWSREDIDRVAASGVRIVGEIDELRVSELAKPSQDGVAESAVEAAVAVLLANWPQIATPPRLSSISRLRRGMRRLVPLHRRSSAAAARSLAR
jgi:hypothetical protein